MDDTPVSETLPETYRQLLDRIADLELAGHRREADLVRRDAIRAYSRRWNQRAASRLDRLIQRAERVLDGRERPRAPYRSRRASLAMWLAVAPARARRRLTDRLVRRRAAQHGGVAAEQPTA